MEHTCTDIYLLLILLNTAEYITE